MRTRDEDGLDLDADDSEDDDLDMDGLGEDEEPDSEELDARLDNSRRSGKQRETKGHGAETAMFKDFFGDEDEEGEGAALFQIQWTENLR